MPDKIMTKQSLKKWTVNIKDPSKDQTTEPKKGQEIDSPQSTAKWEKHNFSWFFIIFLKTQEKWKVDLEAPAAT